MRFGIDIHGVADTKKKFFAKFSQRIVSQGFECHIITGSRRTNELENQLKDWGIQYTHFFSIADYLITQGKEVIWKTPNDPFFKSEDWDSTKAKYCEENKIDLMIDDSDVYGKFFKTLYVKVV